MRMPALASGNISLKCTGDSHEWLEAADRIVAANAVLLAIAQAFLASLPSYGCMRQAIWQVAGERGGWSYDISVFSFFYSWEDALLLS